MLERYLPLTEMLQKSIPDIQGIQRLFLPSYPLFTHRNSHGTGDIPTVSALPGVMHIKAPMLVWFAGARPTVCPGF